MLRGAGTLGVVTVGLRAAGIAALGIVGILLSVVLLHDGGPPEREVVPGHHGVITVDAALDDVAAPRRPSGPGIGILVRVAALLGATAIVVRSPGLRWTRRAPSVRPRLSPGAGPLSLRAPPLRLLAPPI